MLTTESLLITFLWHFGKGTFGGLGELSNSSLTTKKPWFWQLSEQSKKGVNHRNPVDHIFIKFCCKGNFFGLGEHTNSLLATKSPAFGR